MNNSIGARMNCILFNTSFCFCYIILILISSFSNSALNSSRCVQFRPDYNEIGHLIIVKNSIVKKNPCFKIIGRLKRWIVSNDINLNEIMIRCVPSVMQRSGHLRRWSLPLRSGLGWCGMWLTLHGIRSSLHHVFHPVRNPRQMPQRTLSLRRRLHRRFLRNL